MGTGNWGILRKNNNEKAAKRLCGKSSIETGKVGVIQNIISKKEIIIAYTISKKEIGK
jgi:hypothetical protein